MLLLSKRKKKGHLIINCYKKQGDDKERPPTDGDLAIVTSDSRIGEVLVVSVRHNGDEWILASGCTFHMCPNEKWFRTYNKIDAGQVLLDNDMVCHVVGLDSVKI